MYSKIKGCSHLKKSVVFNATEYCLDDTENRRVRKYGFQE